MSATGTAGAMLYTHLILTHPWMTAFLQGEMDRTWITESRKAGTIGPEEWPRPGRDEELPRISLHL